MDLILQEASSCTDLWRLWPCTMSNGDVAAWWDCCRADRDRTGVMLRAAGAAHAVRKIMHAF